VLIETFIRKQLRLKVHRVRKPTETFDLGVDGHRNANESPRTLS